MHADSPYAELGLAPGASEREVKAAWRRLVSQWHPDRNDSASALAKMQRINQAFETIRLGGYLEPGREEPQGEPGSAPDDRSPAQPGADEAPPRTLSRKVKLSLEEAAAGCTQVLRGQLTELCKPCSGVGHHVLASACAECAGAGTVRQRAWYGFFGLPSTCTTCQGDGRLRQTCTQCDGAGKLGTQRYQFSVRIPQGVRDGDLLHIDGRQPRPGQPRAAIDLRVELLPHPFFVLDDDGTVRCTIPVDGFAWVANRSTEVPTLTGMQPLALKRDQLSYRLEGQGFPVQRRGPRGDMLITLLPTFPERFSTDQEILLDQLLATSADASGQPTDARLGKWQQTVSSWQRGRRRGKSA